MLSPSYIIFLNEVCPLTSIKSSNNIQSLIVECYCSVEVSTSIQACNLSPSVWSNIIDFAFVHWFTWKWTSNSINLWSASTSQYWCQSMSTSFEDHISSLFKSFIDKLIAWLRSFTWLASSCQKYSSLFIFNWHEICWDLNINDVRSVGMRGKVVHEQIMSIVYKEM